MTKYRLTATERRDPNNVSVENFTDADAALEAAADASADGFAVRLETINESLS